MNKRIKALMIAIGCLVALPGGALAQLPTPTYGWNLGNTLEPPSGEGSWGGTASQALINGVARAGFNTIRIPCAWDSHADRSTGKIDPAYMARVKQVVDWCYARKLYVIINSHWDGGWLDTSGFKSVDPKITQKVKSYWTQIATAFKNYDDRLLFACTNEPDVKTAAQMSVLLSYEQTFVNTVRGTGGKNRARWLVIQGPSTDTSKTYELMNTLPRDPTPNRLMVEVHYYSPFQYVLMESDADWGKVFYFWGKNYHSLTLPERNATSGEEAYMEAEFQKMADKFVSKGVPVLLGEFMAIKRSKTLTGDDLKLHLAGRTYFHKTVVSKAQSKGLKPVYWCTPGQGDFDWTTGAVQDPDNIRALTGGPALPRP